MTMNPRVSASLPCSKTSISRGLPGRLSSGLSNDSTKTSTIITATAGAVALVTASLMAATTPAFAQAQVQASQETCANLKNLVQRQGRVVIGTGPYLYDTYVNNCPPRASQVPAYLSTRDNPQCFVGYTCGQGNN